MVVLAGAKIIRKKNIHFLISVRRFIKVLYFARIKTSKTAKLILMFFCSNTEYCLINLSV
jgi:hypothetical protein